MVSLETCKKLQEVIITLIWDNLLEDDEPFLNLLSKSKDSKGVLELAAELKKAGNSLFKKGEIDEALEKYGYIVVILARYPFDEECDRLEFLKLAISSLMNSVICFSKKKEFVEVGKICSIVLDFDPYNVKAMHRRALAAIELGKKDWAKFDLRMAVEIDPNNKEVLKKLEEISDKLHKRNSVELSQGDIPVGFGIGLSISKKETEGLGKGDLKKRDESQVNESGSCENENESGSCENEKEQHIPVKEYVTTHCNSSEYETVSPTWKSEDDLKTEFIFNQDDNQEKEHIVDEKRSEEGFNMECNNNRIDEKMEDAIDCSNANEVSSIITQEVDMKSDVCSNDEVTTLDPPQPIHRFKSRKRQDSKLALSSSVYSSLKQGKTLKFYNTKLCSLMEVKILNTSYGQTTKKAEIQIQEKVDLRFGEDQL